MNENGRNSQQILNELKLDQDFIQNITLLDVLNYGNVFIITKDDTIYAFGSNRDGVLGFCHEDRLNELTINEELSDKRVIDFKNGMIHTIARTSDEKVYCWGWNVCGVLGNGRDDSKIYKPELNQYLNDEL